MFLVATKSKIIPSDKSTAQLKVLYVILFSLSASPPDCVNTLFVTVRTWEVIAPLNVWFVVVFTETADHLKTLEY